jgi:hypothetical protein
LSGIEAVDFSHLQVPMESSVGKNVFSEYSDRENSQNPLNDGSNLSWGCAELDDVDFCDADDDDDVETTASGTDPAESEEFEETTDSCASSPRLSSAASSCDASVDSSCSIGRPASGPGAGKASGFKLNLSVTKVTPAAAAVTGGLKKPASRVPTLSFNAIQSESPVRLPGAESLKLPPITLMPSSIASPAATRPSAAEEFMTSSQQQVPAATPSQIEVLVVLPGITLYPRQDVSLQTPSSRAAIGNGAEVNSSAATDLPDPLDPATVAAAIESAFGVNADGLRYYSLQQADLSALLGATEPGPAQPQKQQQQQQSSRPALLGCPQSSDWGSTGSMSAKRASSSSTGSTRGASRTIVVGLEGCTFSMSALKEMIASVDQIKAEAKAMQQQHADKEEAHRHELIRARLAADEARGDYERLRYECEVMVRRFEEERHQAKEELEELVQKYAAVK